MTLAQQRPVPRPSSQHRNVSRPDMPKSTDSVARPHGAKDKTQDQLHGSSKTPDTPAHTVTRPAANGRQLPGPQDRRRLCEGPTAAPPGPPDRGALVPWLLMSFLCVPTPAAVVESSHRLPPAPRDPRPRFRTFVMTLGLPGNSAAVPLSQAADQQPPLPCASWPDTVVTEG